MSESETQTNSTMKVLGTLIVLLNHGPSEDPENDYSYELKQMWRFQPTDTDDKFTTWLDRSKEGKEKKSQVLSVTDAALEDAPNDTSALAVLPISLKEWANTAKDDIYADLSDSIKWRETEVLVMNDEEFAEYRARGIADFFAALDAKYVAEEAGSAFSTDDGPEAETIETITEDAPDMVSPPFEIVQSAEDLGVEQTKDDTTHSLEEEAKTDSLPSVETAIQKAGENVTDGMEDLGISHDAHGSKEDLISDAETGTEPESEEVPLPDEAGHDSASATESSSDDDESSDAIDDQSEAVEAEPVLDVAAVEVVAPVIEAAKQ